MPLLTQYVALLARILLQNLEIFVEVLSLYGQQRNLTVSTPLVRRFLEECRIRSCGQHVIFCVMLGGGTRQCNSVVYYLLI